MDKEIAKLDGRGSFVGYRESVSFFSLIFSVLSRDNATVTYYYYFKTRLILHCNVLLGVLTQD